MRIGNLDLPADRERARTVGLVLNAQPERAGRPTRHDLVKALTKTSATEAQRA
jgi:hypothetical protein